MEKKRKAFRISLIVFCVSVVLAIMLNILKFNVGVEYKKVSAVVEDMERIETGTRKNKTTEFRVVVNYNGRSYRVQNLNNVNDWNKFKPNKTVEVYLSEGQIYASINSMQGDTLIGRMSYISIIASMVLFWVMMVHYDAYWKEKKKTNSTRMVNRDNTVKKIFICTEEKGYHYIFNCMKCDRETELITGYGRFGNLGAFKCPYCSEKYYATIDDHIEPSLHVTRYGEQLSSILDSEGKKQSIEIKYNGRGYY